MPAARFLVLPFAVVTHYQQFCYVTIECQAPAPGSRDTKPGLEPVDNYSFPITNLEVDYWNPNLQTQKRMLIVFV